MFKKSGYYNYFVIQMGSVQSVIVESYGIMHYEKIFVIKFNLQLSMFILG
jgi:hypothetical protein